MEGRLRVGRILAAAVRQHLSGAASTSHICSLPLQAARIHAADIRGASSVMREAWARMPEMSRGCVGVSQLLVFSLDFRRLSKSAAPPGSRPSRAVAPLAL